MCVWVIGTSKVGDEYKALFLLKTEASNHEHTMSECLTDFFCNSGNQINGSFQGHDFYKP